MSSSRVASFVYLLALTFIVQTAFGADPLFHFCSNSGNFSAYDPYEANLKELTGYLSIQAPPKGFGLGSIGQKPNQAYGLALCRGDVSTPDCKTCVVEAGSEIRKCCPYNKEMELYGSNKLYGLTQCTKDLSSTECKKCLDGIIEELPTCCDEKEGGRVVGGSCNFRYEIYPFVNA
ncbi:hypothetical protein Gotri_003584 [Gossypium trilobum]|uniref:Gnk2-homologous domain-containing protein n=1 Tax=Gossypium trilobum TaxID=34281 RepID=A0A7J9F1Y9_9ROSI|nr:hypothetical protein [Gossypium trilobum]